MSSASLASLLDEEPVKIPAWLESLARHSATPAEPNVESEPLLASVTTVEAQNSSAMPELGSPAGDFNLDEESAPLADASVTGTFEVPAPSFGSGSIFADENVSAESAAGSKKGLIFSLLAAGILLAAGGGYWYTHQGAAIFGGAKPSEQSGGVTQPNVSTASPATGTSSLPAPVTQPSSAANAQSTRPGSTIKDSAAPASPNTTLAAVPARAVQPAAASPASVAPSLDAQPAAAQPKKPTLGQIHLAAPKVNRKSDGATVGEADLRS